MITPQPDADAVTTAKTHYRNGRAAESKLHALRVGLNVRVHAKLRVRAEHWRLF